MKIGGRRRALGTLAIMVLCAALTTWLGAVQAGGPQATTLAGDTYVNEADLLDSQAPMHLFWGQVLGVYLDPSGNVIGTGGQGDSAIWTGHYLASQAFRYAVARSHLHGPNLEGPPEWRTRLLDARARILDATGGIHRLVNIAQYWKGGQASLSGGCTDRYPQPPQGSCPTLGQTVPAEAGLLMRFCAPQGAPSYIFGGQGDGVTPLIPWTDGQKWHCKAQISRDQYIGVMLGLVTAFDLYGPDDLATRQEIEQDVTAMAGYLVRHGWSVFYPNGDVTPNNLSQAFYNPLFVINPLERLHMVQAARHVSAVAGTPTEAAQWEAIWREEFASQVPDLHIEYVLAIDQPSDSYYKFNLDYGSNFDVIRLEQDPTSRLILKEAFSDLDASLHSERNAHFEAIGYALTGEQWRLQAAVSDVEDWLSYRNRTVTSVTNSARCGKDIQCVPSDYANLDQPTPAGTVEVATQSSKTLRAKDPLPVDQRPQSDFIWQRSPFELDGRWAANDVEPGIDYLLPYWMLRYYSEVAPPAFEPLPAWPGPTGGGDYPSTIGPGPLNVPQPNDVGACFDSVTKGQGISGCPVP